MAIYHLTAKTVSRGSGSAKSRSEYIDREAKYKRDQKEVLYKESGNMPEWAKEGRQYWEAADTYERGNGRLFKQLEFAIPKELKPEEQKELVNSYVTQLTAGEKLPYSYAIHKGHDRENPHCHLMISERSLDGHDRSPETWFKRANSKVPEFGGAKKTTSLMPKEWLQNARENWSLQANKALERAGHEERIDHRSLETQGITDREPTKHRGPALNAMLMAGKLTAQDVEKNLSEEPTHTRKIEAELAQANRLKQSIADGMKAARQDFASEKDRQLADERARQEQEWQRIAQEKQQQELERARLEVKKQLEAEQRARDRETQRQKSRGMGMS